MWWNKLGNDWNYRLREKNTAIGEWNTVSTNYNKEIKVLNVNPNQENLNQISSWMQDIAANKINVDPVFIEDFNNNPEAYLKENGEFKYDVVFFGTWDNNNNYDLSELSRNEVENFIKYGGGVLFGHDTICLNSDPNATHPYFASLASYCNIDVYSVDGGNVEFGSDLVKVYKKGYLTRYPYHIEERNLVVPYSHWNGQSAKRQYMDKVFTFT